MGQIKGKVICVDSMFLIYLLEKNSEFTETVKSAIRQADKVWSSIIGHLETATGFYKEDDFQGLNTLTILPELIDNFSFVPVNMDISLESARLRAKYPFLKTPDSIHLATGIIKKADFFITDDKKLKKIQEKGIKIMTLTDCHPVQKAKRF